MNDNGKEKYEAVEVSEDALLEAIQRGMKGNTRHHRKRQLHQLSLTAAAVLFLFIGIQIPAVSVYASELPVVGVFIQALRTGIGGHPMEQVTVQVSGDANDVVLTFSQQEKTTENTLAYEVVERSVPMRLEVSFYGLSDSKLPEEIQTVLQDSVAVREVYPTLSLDKNNCTFTIVLQPGYNYEVMEFAQPGEWNLHFYPDAYYEAGAPYPTQQIYYLRSPMYTLQTEEDAMRELLQQYQEEQPSQVKIGEDRYIYAIGAYHSEREAEAALQILQSEYENCVFVVDSDFAAAIPK